MSSRSYRELDGETVRRSYRGMDEKETSPRRSITDLRREREAEALRANLRKRKEQQRAREITIPEKTDPPADNA
jgi:hypothetical protein